MLSVGAAIAALLVGSATVGSKNATPDSPLWPITQVMWPDRAQSVASVNLVRTELSKAQDSLDAGDTREAQLAVLRATTELGKVDDVDGKEDLQNQVSDMWRKAAPAELASTSPFAAPSGSSWPSSPFTDPDPAVVTTAPSLQPPATDGPALTVSCR